MYESTKIRNETGEKKKLLFVITQGEWGGAQRYVYDLATNLAGEFDITVAVGEPNGRTDLQARLAEYKKITFLELQHLVRAVAPLHDWLAIGELAELYGKLNPDIVHLNSSKAGVLGSYAARRLPAGARPRLVYTVHGWVFDEPLAPWRQALYRYLEKTTARDKAAMVVLSYHDAKRAADIGIPKEKIHLIPHGIRHPKNIDSIGVVRDKLNRLLPQPLGQNDFVVGTIANFYPTKGLDILLAALAKIKNQTPRLRAVIIGEGKKRAALEKQIKASGLEKIIALPGFIPDAAQYLRAFNVFALPSRKEGLPYTLLEAKMHAVPIIAAVVGGIPEIITDKKTGLLIPPENMEALAQALLFSYQDYIENRNELRQLAEAGHKESLANLTLNAMLKKTTALYQWLLRP